MLAIAVHHIRHDQDVEALRAAALCRRNKSQQRLDGIPPLVAVDVQDRPRWDQRLAQLRVVAHVLDEVGVGVVGHDGRARARRGADDAGHARCGADLEHISAGC